MTEAVILEAVRVPFGRREGMYRATRPDALLAHTLCSLVDGVGIDPADVEDVIVGCVTQAGEQGANIGRLATLLAGFPVHVPAATLDRMCGSSQQAVHFAAQELIHQGESAERLADKWQISREEADAFAAESHRRAQAAAVAGLNAEIRPANGLDRDGQPMVATRDEGIRPVVDPAKMATLNTVFRPDGNGVVTAGNASQISDGAAAVLVGERERAKADGFRPRARFLARVAVGDDPTLQLAGVIPATHKALAQAGVTLADVDWVEINEAFATVVLAWAREFRPDMEKVNPWGGAIAHGHPLGATGAGLMAKLLAGLEATGGQIGLQVMCIGHGMSTATIVERI